MRRETFTTSEPAWLAAIVPPVLALTVYVLLAYPLRDWLVDDAAISMAYAANWTAGHGLVAQPGLEPVEGYSNPLWVCILALLNLAGLMTVSGIKLVSVALVGLSLVSLDRTCRAIMPDLARFLVLLLVATDSSIVTWCSSGLENPLTLLLACELLRSVQERRAPYAALVVAALSLTRPEGLIFAFFPAVFLRGRDLLRFSLIVGSIFGAFIAARYAYFGDVVPNTFHAKEASNFKPLNNLLSIGALVDNRPAIALGMLALFVAAWWKRNEPALLPPLALMFIAGAVFVLMPPDWMPDRRFATPFIPAAAVFAGYVVGSRPLLIALALAVTLPPNIAALRAMYAAPTVPMSDVIRDARRFNSMGGESILLPDIGGALLVSNLRVYDLAGLTDKRMAKLIWKDRKGLHDYVFDELRPTYIKTHTNWTKVARFEADLRFRREYRPIGGGEYVRREAIRPSSR